jgi:hypothetical protein
MQSDQTNPAVPKKAVTPRHALLENLIDIVHRHVSEQFLDFTNRVAAALVDGDIEADMRVLQARLRAGNLLRSGHYGYLSLVKKELEKALRHEIAELAPGQKAKPKQAAQSLSLVSMEEMDTKVAMGAVAKPFEVQYADALATLNVRLAFLLDRDILRVNQNPFRPEVLLGAMQQAWLAFCPDEEAQDLLLALLKPDLFMELSPMFGELNDTLQRKAAQPGSVDSYKTRKADSHDASSASPARQRKQQAELAQQLRQFFGGAQDPAADPALLIPDLPDIANLKAGAWAQGPAQHFQGDGNNAAAQHAAQAAAKQPLFSFLSQVQQGGLAAAGIAGLAPGAMPGVMYAGIPAGMPGAMPAADGAAAGVAAGTVAGTAAGAFGAAGMGGMAGLAGLGAAPNVFYLPSIKQQAPQGALTRADESTIDLLSAVFDTVFRDQNISQEIRDLMRFLQIPVLKAALVDKDFFFQDGHPARRLIDLLSRMGWEQRKSPDDPLFQAMQRSVERVGRDHDHELSVFTEAVNELEASLKADETAEATAMAAPIAAALKQEKMAEAARSAKHAVALRIGTGEVVAVVEAFLENRWVNVLTLAYSVEEEKPGAVKHATQTMDDLIWSVKPKITPEERKQLIGKLPKLLATLNKWLDIIKWQDAERLQFFAELAECHASIVRAPLEVSPDRQVELAMEAAQKAAERRQELAAQEAARAQAAAPPPQDDDAVVEVDSLARGDWLEFDQDDGSRRKVKLAWISPLKTLYIFSTHTRQEAFSLSGEAMARKFREGKVRVFRPDGLVGRALSQAMGQAAVNDADMAAPGAAA